VRECCIDLLSCEPAVPDVNSGLFLFMDALTYHDFESLIAERRAAGASGRLAVPVYRRRSADLLTPVGAYLALRRPGAFGFLLESVEGGEQLGRYSFLGRDPYLVLEAHGEQTYLRHTDACGDGAGMVATSGDAFNVLSRLLAEVEEVRLPGLPRFTGGAVGALGYDAVRLLERLPDAPYDDLGTPDALWAFYDTVAAMDHVARRLVLVATTLVDPDSDLEAAFADAQRRLDALEADLNGTPAQPAGPFRVLADAPASNVERADFEAAVRRAQHHIREGDIFQTVLSRRMAVPFAGDPFTFYRALRQVNPSPYLFYLDFEQADGRPLVLAGSSPEVLVRVEGERAEVLPIAGTRPRGSSIEEDAALEAELVADAKEQAEHLMLVDLGRNDLGRTCRPGSVRVERYAEVERYARVMHLVSRVSGVVATGRSAVDVLAAAFPAGTVSGAPKVRAMELIDELEPTRRGLYAGAVGYADFSGNMDTCLTIRTALLRPSAGGQGTAYVQAGAGIVADSDPGREFEETEAKARALFDAFLVATSLA
jgi:anthranilate synthase component I